MAVILVDTRQQVDKHKAKHDWMEAHGHKLVRTKLYAGDYMLVGGVRTVDTKRSLLELAQCIDQGHERFRRELVNARDAGFELTILTENKDGVSDIDSLARWENPRRFLNEKKGLRPPIDGMRMAKACLTMQEKYGARFEFCKPEDAGAKVIEILEGGSNCSRNQKRT